MIRFSIVTITFNASHTLPRTLRSVAEQKWAALEHIIIDGASTDGTLQRAEAYKQEQEAGETGSMRTVSLLSEPDRGLYDAMNKGLARATGDYVLFLNAGDCFPSPDTLSSIAARPECQSDDRSQWPAVLYGQTDVVDDEGRFVAHRHLTAPRHLTWRSFMRGMLVCHQAFYARTDLARTLPYDLQYRFSADVDWCIRVMKKAHKRHLPLLYLDAVVALYLQEGQTTRNHRASLKERFRVMVHHYGWLPTLAMHAWFVVRAWLK